MIQHGKNAAWIKGDYRTRKTLTRRRVKEYLEKRSRGDKVKTWREYKYNLSHNNAEDIAIKEELAFWGLKEDNDELVKA